MDFSPPHSLAKKWDYKYAQTTPGDFVPPAWVLKQHGPQLPLKGKGLDLACGLGGNARFMAQCGLTVDAWDISDIALTQLNNYAAVNRLSITPTLCDFEQMLFPYQQYDVIVVSKYLNRALFSQIEQALKPGGKLFIQTFLAPVQNNAPSNPSFYLNSGELNHAFPSLTTEIYGEGFLKESNTLSAHRYAWYIGHKLT